MNIFFIALIVLIFYMLIDYRKAFLLFTIFNIFLNVNINIINLPGVPKFSVSLFGLLVFGIWFFLVRGRRKTDFPFKPSFLIALASIIISTVLSTVGFGAAFTRAIQEIMSDYLFIYLIWNNIRTKNDLHFVLKGLLVAFLILCVYGVFEKISGTNPLMNYELSLNPAGKAVNWDYDKNNRLGQGRVRSAVIHAIGFGVYISCFVGLFLFMLFKHKQVASVSLRVVLVVMTLCILCLFFTNSRSPMIFLALLCVPYFNPKKKSFYVLISLGFLSLIVLYRFISPYFQNITSLIGSAGDNEKVGGSSFEMRISQFQAAYSYFKDYLFFGMGIKSLDQFFGGDTGILGGESIWIQICFEKGLFGAFTYLFIMFQFFRFPKGKNARFFRWFVLAWLILNTITSIPGCGLWFFGLCYILMQRMEESEVIK